MAVSDELAAALQAAHNLEATASERLHKQEHCFKDTLKKYPKLGKWFDRRHKEAYSRQHDLRKLMMSLGLTVETELGDTSYTDDVAQAFEDTCDLLDEIMDAYLAINDAAKEEGGRTGKAVREYFHGTLKHLAHVYHKGEQLQQQLKDLELPLFLSKHM